MLDCINDDTTSENIVDLARWLHLLRESISWKPSSIQLEKHLASLICEFNRQQRTIWAVDIDPRHHSLTDSSCKWHQRHSWAAFIVEAEKTFFQLLTFMISSPQRFASAASNNRADGRTHFRMFKTRPKDQWGSYEWRFWRNLQSFEPFPVSFTLNSIDMSESYSIWPRCLLVTFHSEHWGHGLKRTLVQLQDLSQRWWRVWYANLQTLSCIIYSFGHWVFPFFIFNLYPPDKTEYWRCCIHDTMPWLFTCDVPTFIFNRKQSSHANKTKRMENSARRIHDTLCKNF